MKKPIAGLLLAVLLLGGTFLSLALLRAPAVQPASAPAEVFSAERAWEHLKNLAVRPHPVGSDEHRRVRDEIVTRVRALGYEPVVEEGVGLARGVLSWTGAVAQVANVVVRIPGSAPSRPVVFAAHYDSVAAGVGAADDMVGVVALLETLRALKSVPAPKNDLIFLFTDGEEVGLVGAEAYLARHPEAKELGVFVNFEARGTRGPTLLFETGRDNRWLIEQLVDAGAPIFASSYSYEVYRRLPNDTDYTVFRKEGVPGLNFAFIHGAVGYHTEEDSLERLDTRSLQHHGELALALARRLGQVDFQAPRPPGDAVYFNLLGQRWMVYPGAWVQPLLGLVALLVLAALGLGWQRGKMKPIGLAKAFGIQLGAVLAAGALAYFAGGLLFPVPFNFRVWSNGSAIAWTLAALSFLALGAGWVLDRTLRQKIGGFAIGAGGALLWLLFALMVSLVAPGASYLFVVPLGLQALGLLFVALGRTDDPARMPVLGVAGFAVAAVATALLWAPTLALVAVGLLTGGAAPVVALAVLLMILLSPQLGLIRTVPFAWLIPTGLFLTGAVFLIGVSARSRFTPESPRPTSLFYALDADKGEATWASFDSRLDDWSRRVLPPKPERKPLPEFVGFNRPLAVGPAPVLPLAPPELDVLARETTSGGGRRYHLRVRSPLSGDRMRLRFGSESDLVVQTGGRVLDCVRVPNQPRDPKRCAFLFYAAPPEGLELVVETTGATALDVQLIDQRYGLPEVPGGLPGPRPDGAMQSGNEWDSDTVLVRKVFKVEPEGL
jgi:Peptidase family M28